MSVRLPYDPEVMTPLPTGLVVRLVDHARLVLRRELRWNDPDADAVEVLESFLATRDGGPARSLPTPSAEPGDLLVKVGRAEFWTFTVGGWRELAPVELVFYGETPHGEEFRTAEPPDFGGGAQKRRLGPISDHGAHGGISGAAQNVGEAPPTPPLIRAADELHTLAGAIRRTIEVAELPDLGVDDRLRAFAEGLETAERIVTGLER
jgi:hypothetical protein